MKLLLIGLVLTLSISCQAKDKAKLMRNGLFGVGNLLIANFDSEEYAEGGNIKNCEWVAKVLNDDHQNKGYTGDIRYFCVYNK